MDHNKAMEQPLIAATKPCLVNLVAGRTYYWCACGKSAKQPFCDGSHKGTPFEPLAFTAETGGEHLLCACKRTRAAPYCDGSHNSLSDRYGAPMDDAASCAAPVRFVADAAGALRAGLDNGCYVIRPQNAGSFRRGALTLHQVIGPGDGARHLSQFAGRVTSAAAPVVAFGASDAAVFVIDGHGAIEIGSRRFTLAPHNGAYVRGGEAFRLIAAAGEELAVNITVCPLGPLPEGLETMPDHFDPAVPERVTGVDPAKRSAMADRFYQVLIDGETRGAEVTQFIGHIPRSRAAHHRHLYEETLTVLSGHGVMWTDATKADLQPGDTVFLPRKQSHSVECTSADGMLLVGVFYPSMSPAINY